MSGKDECITVPALGRPFKLGLLYDCRSDTLSSATFLNKSTLSEKDSESKRTTTSNVDKSDSTDEVSSGFDISANMKISVLAGLLDVSGSGDYFKSKTRSVHKESFDLKFKTMDRHESLTVEFEKWKEQYQAVFDNVHATHVVTGIDYGGLAFFKYREDTSSKSKASVKKIGAKFQELVTTMINTKAKGEIRDSEKEIVGHFKYQYFGDFRPSENPTSLADAMHFYKDMPTLLGKKGEHAVPIKVYLFPLSNLDSRADKLVREINHTAVMEIEETMSDFLKLEMQCTDIIESEIVKSLPGIGEEVKQFKRLIEQYKRQFIGKLSELVPIIRSGKGRMDALECLLRENKSSPFDQKVLKSWIDGKAGLVDNLSATISKLPVKYASRQGSFKTLVLNSSRDSHIICFSILLPESNKQLTSMESYMKCKQSNKDIDVTDEGKEVHVKTEIIGDDTLKKAKHFKDFVLANKNNSNTTFIVEEGTSDSHELKVKVTHYKDGEYYQDFKFPSAPPTVSIVKNKTTHNSITAKWDRPLHASDTIQYRISCTLDNGNTTTMETSGNVATIINLEPDCEYHVSVQSFCEAGCSPHTKAKGSVKTKLDSLPQELLKICNSSNLIYEGIDIYKLPLKEVDNHYPNGIKTFEFGSLVKNMQEKVIIFVGTRGSGKRFLINRMVNYVVNPDGKSEFRLVDEPNSQSQGECNPENIISIYTIHHKKHFRVSYTLRIIDIPEFHELANIDSNKIIRHHMCSLFTTEGIGGVSRLDALCIVTQSSPPVEILDHFLSLFGKDADHNIFHVLNVCHDQTPDDKRFFRFKKDSYNTMFVNADQVGKDNNTNSANNCNPAFLETDTNLREIEDFFKELKYKRPMSLRLTKKVVHQNLLLETALITIKNETDSTMRLFNQLFYRKGHVNVEEDFVYTVTEITKDTTDVPLDQLALNCPKCDFTCRMVYKKHDHTRDRSSCDICTTILGCFIKTHEWSPIRHIQMNFQSEKTNDELGQLCRRCADKGKLVDSEIKDFDDQLCKVKERVEAKIQTAKDSLVFLKGNTLRQDPLHKVSFIDKLINSEWQSQRVKLVKLVKLEEAKRVAKVIKKLTYGYYKPMSMFRDTIKRKLCYGEYVLKASVKNSGLLNIYLSFCKLDMKYH